KTGMDKAMTALATPYLNQFSEDLTLMAQFNHFDPCVARETEQEEVFRIVEGGGQNVLLVGDHGTGKRSIIQGIAQKMVEEDVPARLQDKRFVQLSVSSLLAGTTPAGAMERLIHMMNEIARARNVILFINNLHELAGVAAGGEHSSLDVADTLADYLKGNRFLTFATTTDESYAQVVVNSPLGNVFSKVEVKEMNENQAIQVLESKAGMLEYKQNIFLSYDAVEKAVKLSKRFLHDIYLPGSALEVMSEAAAYGRNQRGANTLIMGEDVSAVIAEKTKIPVTTVSSDESSKLLVLEKEMHKRVIGQDEAVNLVANALRRARAEIRSTTRPIANFLFMGPTGVGKTELAKTIATVYFGGENRMIRLDMSEYQDKASIYRLIGAPGEKGTGILTEAVRRNPFSLVLLDEIEKADKDIINLFLQVMDDGRLTDSTGRVVDFTSVILVTTSNAGTSYVQEQLRAGIPSDSIKEKLLHGELQQYFRPEFLNRFDGIVLFKALEREDIKKIAALMLKRLAKDLEAKGMELVVEDSAIDFLADVGFDKEFGARPMRRAIQEKIENRLAELLLAGKLKRKDKIVLGRGGEISVM
ncbi:ATP-dependent Clp protease ATP-binding subunit, partial [Patescibacteria group bacterium]|nr:ATP-dependent Clp protease ATP-binding subunit [Patescibacteria group bacterium]